MNIHSRQRGCMAPCRPNTLRGHCIHVVNGFDWGFTRSLTSIMNVYPILSLNADVSTLYPWRIQSGVRTGDRVQESDDDVDLWMRRIRSYPSPSARSVALEQLLRVDEEGAFAGLVSGSPDGQKVDVLDKPDVVNQSISSSNSLDSRERRQVTEIVSGVLRWQRRLHWILTHLKKPTKMDTMDSPLRILLYMGAYELLELNMASHAVNEYVNLAKYVMHDGCGKVANGVLRSLIRAKDGSDGQGLPIPPKPHGKMSKKEVAQALGVIYSHPTWMVYKWLGEFGAKETVSLLSSNNKRPTFSVRVKDMDSSLASMRELGADVEPSKYLPTEYIVVKSGLQHIIAGGFLQKGQAQVQDEAAGMVVAMLNPQPHESVLDCCSAPGGKTMFAAARMNGNGTIVALDAVESRMRAVKHVASKHGYDSIVTCVVSDARQYCENAFLSGDVFDKVLVDAPCSGTGVLAKRSDMRWRRKDSDFKVLVSLQSELLSAASKVVRPGGFLIYSTCSIEREENQDIVREFLERHSNFELVPGSAVEGIPSTCLDKDGCLQMLPHHHGTDGAFAARLQRIV